jgi:DNA polymerase/3'-5' exonuclease PolX
MKTRMSLPQAQRLAEKIVTEIRPFCERVEIAGSIRRRKPTVGDIEIVCIPRHQPDLFGDPGESLLDIKLLELLKEGRLSKGRKNGDKQKEFIVPSGGCQLDLFITSPDCWPVIFTVRTGSEDFTKRLVTQKNKGGLLPSNLHVDEGRVWKTDEGTPLALKEEADLLALCGGWVEPWERI